MLCWLHRKDEGDENDNDDTFTTHDLNLQAVDRYTTLISGIKYKGDITDYVRVVTTTAFQSRHSTCITSCN